MFAFPTRAVVRRKIKKKYIIVEPLLQKQKHAVESMDWGRKSSFAVSVWAGEIVAAGAAAAASSTTARLWRRLVADSPLALCTLRGRGEETYRSALLSGSYVASLDSQYARNGRGDYDWKHLATPPHFGQIRFCSARGRWHFLPVFFLHFLAECRGHFGFFYCLCVTKSY